MKVTMIGLDIGKRVFHLVAQDAAGPEGWRRKVSRARLLVTLAQVPACTVVMESCSGAQHTRAYVRGNKNDCTDAEAIVAAASRPRTRSVPLKTLAQQDIQALHLFIHGARTVVYHALGKDDGFSNWINRLRARRGMNVAIVAVANKNARMAWALLHKQSLGQLA